MFSLPWLNRSAYKSLPLPYTKKLMDLGEQGEREGGSAEALEGKKGLEWEKGAHRAGTAPARVGPRPLNSADAPSNL